MLPCPPQCQACDGKLSGPGVLNATHVFALCPGGVANPNFAQPSLGIYIAAPCSPVLDRFHLLHGHRTSYIFERKIEQAHHTLCHVSTLRALVVTCMSG